MTHEKTITMVKKILFSTLFIMISYCYLGQSGRYLVILEDGFCSNAPNYYFMPNPRIIVINPTGAITVTQLTTSTSIQDILDHTAQFNAIVSNIMDQGYTTNPSSSRDLDQYIVANSYASLLGAPDNPCSSGGTATNNHAVVSLIPCCSPPWTGGADVLSENNPFHIAKVFPNPSNDLIHLEVKFAVGRTPETVLVYDIMGKILLTTSYATSAEDNVELNISNLSAGIYFVKLSGGTLESKPMPFCVY